jgi:hypothetical protein
LDVQTPQSRELAADIARLETGIRQLKVQYDMFFAGSLKRPPNDAHAALEKLIKKHLNSSIPQYAQRFHFHALVSRFNSLSELWSRTVRTMEEGTRAMPGARGRRDAEPERMLAQCRIHDPRKDDEAMRELFKVFVEARRKTGEHEKPISYDKFVRGVAGHAHRLQKTAGCDEIELRLVVRDDKVQLKARPGR